MKRLFTVITLLFLVPTFVLAQNQTNKVTEQIDPLIGNWKIDLRPTPESDGYYQSFVVEMTEGNTFSGTFYGSEIKNGLINRNWNKMYFAFSTSDQNNDYYHSGYLENDSFFGMTYCPNRAFAAPWIGVKE